ncbi:hypothetical protein [Corynebacterium pyruviciproducens]|uniref:hypothetical protein n=1 Tax=Corynebacterium pyruviciproducens TaxID=598660 RepID=UPI00254D91F2|nr:hypothetical protein [Corynebacterium pyruviciproducens]MDK7213386.1 hypothetical protein [Corynebacterium pyruviciproducens]
MWIPHIPSLKDLTAAVDSLEAPGTVTLEPVTIERTATTVTVTTPAGQWQGRKTASTKKIVKEAARLGAEWQQAVIDGLLGVTATGNDIAAAENTLATLRARRVEEARHLAALGVTAYRIAQHAGASEAAVGRWLRTD